LYLNILKSEKNFPHFPHSPHFPITFTIKCKKSTLVRLPLLPLPLLPTDLAT
jgi:hypothetical protein